MGIMQQLRLCLWNGLPATSKNCLSCLLPVSCISCKHAFCIHMYPSLFMAMLIVYFTFWLVMGFVMHLGFLGLADIYEENWGKVTEKLKPSDTRKSINSEQSV